MKRDFDVVVVGAGPAGSTAARVAAERGLAVLLIDRAGFPRVKPCAGGVTAKVLRELDFELPDSVIEGDIRGLKVVSPCGRSVSTRDVRRLGVIVKRSVLDNFLMEKARKAGASVLDGTGLIGLESDMCINGRCHTVMTSRGRFTARAIVGADGALGKTARLAGIRQGWSRWELGASLSAEVDFPAGLSPQREPELIELYCVPPLRGAFGWAFHRRQGVHIGVGATALDGGRLPQAYQTLFIRVMEAMGLERSELPCPKPRGHILPMGGLRREIARDGVFLVGDAAGFVDPFSGEGIYHAIRSGRIAAEELVTGIRSGDLEGSAREHTRRCYGEFMQELRLSLCLAVMLGRKGGSAFSMARANPSLLSLLADILHEAGSYRRLFASVILRSPKLVARFLMERVGMLKS